MASQVPCEPHGGEHAARFILTDLEEGTASAMCPTAFGEFVLGTAAEIDAAAGGPEERAEADGEAVARVEGESPEPEHVVKRGTSRSRKAYEARRRAKAADTDEDTDDDEDEAPEPSDEPTEPVSDAAAVGTA